MKSWYELRFNSDQEMLDTYDFLLHFGHTKNQYPIAEKGGFYKMVIGDDIIVVIGAITISNTVLIHFNNIEFFYDEG